MPSSRGHNRAFLALAAGALISFLLIASFALPHDDGLGLRAEFNLRKRVQSRWEMLHKRLRTLIDKRDSLQAARERERRLDQASDSIAAPDGSRFIWSWNRVRSTHCTHRLVITSSALPELQYPRPHTLHAAWK